MAPARSNCVKITVQDKLPISKEYAVIWPPADLYAESKISHIRKENAATNKEAG